MSRVRARAAELRLEYLLGGLATYLPGETLGPRLSQDFELVWIIQGKVTYQLPEQEYEAPPGSVILSRPGFHERYTWDARRHTKHAYFHFAMSSRPDDWPDPASWPVCRVMPSGDAVRPLFRQVVDRYCYGAPRRPTQVSAELLRIVSVLIDCFLAGSSESEKPPVRRHSDAVEQALSFAQSSLLDDPGRKLSLLELARAAGTSPQHLCRLFAAGPGVGPMQAVRLLRLEQAAALLARSTLSVKQIAARCGFASQFHFSRAFREVYGATPSDVRMHTASGFAQPVPKIALELPHTGRWTSM